MKKTLKSAQFDLEHNVLYRVVNRFEFARLLEMVGVKVSVKAMNDLELMQKEARKALDRETYESLLDKASRPIFTENKFGKTLLNGIRSVFGDAKQAGFLKDLTTYGLRINGLTGSWGLTSNKKNLVTDAGKAGVASRINGAGSEAAFTYIATGTGTTAANAADTALETELATSGLSRANSSASRVTTTVTNDTAQLVNTFNVTGSQAVTESGVLNAGASGVLLCRQVFSAINVVNGDSLQITWKVKAA